MIWTVPRPFAQKKQFLETHEPKKKYVF